VIYFHIIMSFAELLERYNTFDAGAYCASVTPLQAERAIKKGRLDEFDYLALLSPAAASPRCLEMMAQRARNATRNHFGNVIFLFTPLYVSNICDNFCPYCSFAHHNRVKRRHLSAAEVRREAQAIAQTGLHHILMLTGESRKGASVRYLRECASALREFFSSIAIEVYPLDEGEYAELTASGIDGLTIYQETYDRAVYESLHMGGPKANFEYRLTAPERACRAGMRAVTVGALLGLADPLKDAWLSGLHAKYLLDKFPSVEISASFPRLRPQEGDFEPPFSVNDRTFVQYMTAFRIFMPSAGITVSTRESAPFRDAILPLGPTKMSAGVCTAVGQESGDATESQFEIADHRSVSEMQRDLLNKGFQPVTVDWNYILCRETVSS